MGGAWSAESYVHIDVRVFPWPMGMCTLRGDISGGESSRPRSWGRYAAADSSWWPMQEHDESESSLRSIDSDFSGMEEHMLEGVRVLIS